MDLSKTTVLKDFDKFIRLFDSALDKEALKIHAFLITAPCPNFSVSFFLPREKFEILKTECADNIDPDYAKCKRKLVLEMDEVLYVFICR